MLLPEVIILKFEEFFFDPNCIGRLSHIKPNATSAQNVFYFAIDIYKKKKKKIEIGMVI